MVSFTPSDKRKLSEKQREKMKEKRDSSHIPAMYSACDNSQSRSQYYDDTQVVLIKPKWSKRNLKFSRFSTIKEISLVKSRLNVLTDYYQIASVIVFFTNQPVIWIAKLNMRLDTPRRKRKQPVSTVWLFITFKLFE